MKECQQRRREQEGTFELRRTGGRASSVGCPNRSFVSFDSAFTDLVDTVSERNFYLTGVCSGTYGIQGKNT